NAVAWHHACNIIQIIDPSTVSKLISSADLAPSESASADDRLRMAPVFPDRGGGVPNDVIDQADHKNASCLDVYHIYDTIDTHYPFFTIIFVASSKDFN
ncbi:MAG: hypothetical protein ACKPKO_19885, partial [Candidatus Fonsibacter sp.]